MIKEIKNKDLYIPIYKNKENFYVVSWNYEDAYIIINKEEKDDQGHSIIVPYRQELYGQGIWVEEYFVYKPEVSEIRNLILDYYDRETDLKILSGFRWNDMSVWLSLENLFNYKAAYDLAIQTNGATLPVTFKFGISEEPVYHTFETLEDLTDFYTKAIAFIQLTLSEGWLKKDSVDWSIYEYKEEDEGKKDEDEKENPKESLKR